MGHIVAAIDLGTSRTAYSYTVTQNQEKAKPEVYLGVPDKLEDCLGLEHKTATSILLERPNGGSSAWHLKTFGDEAEETYLEAKQDGEAENLALFKNFKMELYRGGRSGVPGRRVDDVMGIATDNKAKVPLVLVVSLALSHIKDQIIERLDKAKLGTIGASDIRWVVTVPAIWSEFGKTFMRIAACRAGLVANEHDYENLSLCLEPEAACLSVEASTMEPWVAGTKLMVLDCGGGTIDITTHHVKSSSPLTLEELHEPTGGPWGSTIVDAKFKDFIKNLLDCESEEWDHLDASTEMLRFYRQWEEKKTGYRPDKSKSIRLRMGEILDVMKMDAPTFEATVNKETHPQQKKRGVSASGKTLTIEPDKVASLFEDVIDDITRKTKEVIERENGISVVYMVGGFSCSPLLQGKVTARVTQLHRNIKVVFPPRPSLAIVLGAALHGANGSSIVCRKARLTYGTRTNTEYDPRNPEHEQRSSKVKAIEDKMYLEAFHSFVERGEDLPVGTKREHTFYPLKEDQKEVSFRISVSRRPAAAVKFLKDAGVSNAVSTIFTVTAPVDTGVSFSDRGLLFSLSFGGTEIHILIKRCSDGLEVPATTIFVENMDEETDEGIAQPLLR